MGNADGISKSHAINARVDAQERSGQSHCFRTCFPTSHLLPITLNWSSLLLLLLLLVLQHIRSGFVRYTLLQYRSDSSLEALSSTTSVWVEGSFAGSAASMEFMVPLIMQWLFESSRVCKYADTNMPSPISGVLVEWRRRLKDRWYWKPLFPLSRALYVLLAYAVSGTYLLEHSRPA